MLEVFVCDCNLVVTGWQRSQPSSLNVLACVCVGEWDFNQGRKALYIYILFTLWIKKEKKIMLHGGVAVKAFGVGSNPCKSLSAYNVHVLPYTHVAFYVQKRVY